MFGLKVLSSPAELASSTDLLHRKLLFVKPKLSTEKPLRYVYLENRRSDVDALFPRIFLSNAIINPFSSCVIYFQQFSKPQIAPFGSVSAGIRSSLELHLP